MAAKSSKKGLQQRHPGLAEFARIEGCDYSHLRRVIVLRERPSPLLKKFRAWKKQQRAAENAKLFPPAAAAEVARAATHLANTLPQS